MICSEYSKRGLSNYFTSFYLRTFKCTKCNKMRMKIETGCALQLSKYWDNENIEDVKFYSLQLLINSYFDSNEVELACTDKACVCREQVQELYPLLISPFLIIEFKMIQGGFFGAGKLQTTLISDNCSGEKISIPVSKYPELVLKTIGNYQLVGVGKHHGSTNKSGHYIACTYNILEGKWYNYSDMSVEPLRDNEKPFDHTAIVLFYVSEELLKDDNWKKSNWYNPWRLENICK